MVFQVQEETWLDNQEIQGTILCKRVYPEEVVSKTPKLISSSGTMGHSEFNVYFAVYSRFVESKYWLQNAFAQADITSGETVFIELLRDFNSDGEQGDVWYRG